MATTTRHKKAAKNIGKYRTESEALVKADYSESYALSGHIKKTKGWNEIMQKALPDSLLAKRHRELLNKQEVIAKNNISTKEIDIIPTGEIDVQAVSKGLDMAYKLKGSYAPEKSVNLNVEVEASEEIKALADKLNEMNR